MKVLDPGHTYALDHLDDDDIETVEILRFVKRIGEKYPGNRPPAYSGTTSQEVLRALIDRMFYVDGQEPHDRNKAIITSLLDALRELELRAAEKRGDTRAIRQISASIRPDKMPPCDTCGHLYCTRHG